MGELVNVRVTDGVATIRLDRPPMNAISVQVQAELCDAAAAIKPSPEDIAAQAVAKIAERLRQRRAQAIAELRERSGAHNQPAR